MKKDYFNLRLRSRWLLVTLLALLAGASPTWAQEAVTESFEYASDGTTAITISEDAMTLSNGWTVVGSGSYAGIATSGWSKTLKLQTSGARSGNCIYAGSNSAVYIVCPVEVSGTLSFYWKRNDGSGTIKIYAADKDEDTYTIGSLLATADKTTATNTSSYFEFSTDLGSDPVYVAFLLNYAYLDDVTYTPYVDDGSMKKPKALTVSDVTANSAVLSWTAGGTETAWEVSYSATSGNPDNGTIVSASEATYTLTGLTAETTYYAAVRARDGENFSSWTSEVSFTPTKAKKLTVNDGSSTNSYVPIYGNYVDYYDKVEFIIPAADLADMANSDIKAMKFYLSSPAATSWGNANFKIYMTEVENTTVSSYTFNDNDFTALYNGSLDGTKSEMDITLTTPYSYNGGNLLVGVYNTVKGSFKSSSFYGASAEYGASAYGTNSSSLAGVTSVNKQSFLPKTTFTYLPIDGAVMKVSETAFDFGTITPDSPEADKQKTFTISNKGNATLENISVSYTGDNVFSLSDGIATSIAEGGDDIIVTVTMNTTTPGDYNGTITVSATDQTPVEISLTASYAAAPATMGITLGEEAVGGTVAFGNVGKAISKTFTVTNTGNLTLNISSIVSSNTDNFTVSPATLTVAGGSSETFTVSFVYDAESLGTEKTANITITPSNEGLSPVEFTVSATSIEQWSEDFSGSSLPKGWEAESYNYNETLYGWTIANNVAKAKYRYGYSYYLTTPSLTVESTTDVLSFDYAATANQVTITIEKSKDGGDWETCNPTTAIGTLSSGNSGTATITGLEAGNYKFRFKSDDYNLDNFQGFKLNNDDPKFGIYTDSGCTAAAATSVTKDFGFATEAPEAQVYYLKNDGTGTLTLTLGDVPTGFTANLGKTSLSKDESTTLTINMPVETKGYHGGNIVVTAKNSSDTALGTFTVAASGVVVDDSKLNLDFTSDDIPTSWTKNSWAKNASGYIENSTYSSSSIVTSKLTAVAGEELVIEAKMFTASYTLGVNYKKEGDENWTELIPAANIGTNWTLLHATLEEAGSYQLQFVGTRAQIRHIYGLKEVAVPTMTLDKEGDYNFGLQTSAAEYVITVTNDGNANLTDLAAVLTNGEESDYTVSVSETTVAPGKTATITVTQKFDLNDLGSHSDVLTISSNAGTKTINLSGSTRDGSKLYVDFANNAFPENWTIGNNWAVTSGYAYQSSSSTPTKLVTTPLTVAENETLSFKVAKYDNGNKLLKIRYSQDGGVTWSDYVEYYNTDEASSSYTTKEVTGLPAGDIILEFYGNNIKIDNIQGFGLTNAPALALTESDATVASGDTKEFGNLTADGVATYTLKNIGNANMESTVTTTGEATAVISGEGEGITIAENTVTLAAGKSATITLTVPYTTSYGEKSGVMTIATEGWVDNMVVNYTATTIDETAIAYNFDNNTKPAGWFVSNNGNGFSFASGNAKNSLSSEQILITEQVQVSGTEDILTYDASASSSYSVSSATLEVSYSTDRVNWTPVAEQPTLGIEAATFQVKGLAAGNYYLQFKGKYVTIDNIYGWHKVVPAPEHDLYLVSTDLAATTVLPEASYTVNVSVASLRANETVNAELWIQEGEKAAQKVAELTEQAINNGATKAFELTYNMPDAETTYKAWATVYNANASVTTDKVDVVVSHTRTLQITNIARTSEETVDADANNEFTSTFNVTVKNNGTIAQDAANVSVSITDAEGNVLNGNATTWTAANSQTVFIVPGEFANDNAVLAIYRFNTGEEDAEWAELTKISDNFYSAELNNKAKFIIVRLKNSENDGYVADNNGLNWSNKHNQSVDLVSGTANCFTFNGWDDNDGNNYYFGYSTMAELAVGVSTTMSVSVTTSALEGGLFTLKAKENLSNTVSTTSATVTVNAAAPKFELALNSTAIEDGDAVAYGIVKKATTKTFTISNTGNKLMEAPSISVPEGYEYEKVAVDGAEAEWMLFFYKDDTVDADQGNFKATATDGKFVIENVTVPVEGVNFAVHKKNGNDWYDIYGYSEEGGHLNTIAKATKLATATNASGWMTIAAGNYDFIWNANDLTLLAKPAGSILAGETADVKVTLKAEQGKKNGNLTFTYKVDATTNNTFNVALSGRSVSENTWVVDFENGQIPADWDNSNGWTVYQTDGNYVIRMSGWYEKSIMTPRLAAKKDEVLNFDVLSLGNSITYAYSTDKTNWSDEVVINATGEQTFTAPAAGNYYLRFTGRNAYLDNFVGFELNIPEHDTEIAAENIPTTGTEYAVYTATVTLKENAGKAEEVTAKLFVNNDEKATKAETLTANGQTTITLTWTPEEAITDVKAYITVTGTEIELTTAEVDLTINEAYTLDEAPETPIAVTEGTYATIVLKRTFVAGWNTVCLPFAITDVEAFFGEGAKAYDFTSYANEELNFDQVSSLSASIPYIVYVENAITEPMILNDITISSYNTDAFYRNSNGAKFQGTYAPMAAGTLDGKYGVTSAAKIGKGNAETKMKGFRAYFEFTTEAPAGTRLVFFNEDGTATSINAVELNKQMEGTVYNLKGQRVETMNKGNLYIINGKKAIKK